MTKRRMPGTAGQVFEPETFDVRLASTLTHRARAHGRTYYSVPVLRELIEQSAADALLGVSG